MSAARPWSLIFTSLIGAVAVASVLVMILFLDRYTVPTSSMEPTVEPGERVWTRSVSGTAVERGDIIIFRLPDSISGPTSSLISRAVAVGGDAVHATEGRLSLEGDGLVVVLYDKRDQSKAGHLIIITWASYDSDVSVTTTLKSRWRNAWSS